MTSLMFTVALGVVLIMAAFELPLPDTAGAICFIIGLLLFIVAGLPLMLLSWFARRRFAWAEKPVAPQTEAWAAHHDFQYYPRLRRKEANRSRPFSLAQTLYRAMNSAGNGSSSTDTPAVRHFRRLVFAEIAVPGMQQDCPMVAVSFTKTPAPDAARRLIGVQTRHSLPDLTITDIALDEVWVKPQQQLESTVFNDRWRVLAKDKRYASDMVHPRLMQRFETAPLTLERVDLRQGWLFAWIAPNTTGQDLDLILQLLLDLWSMIPTHAHTVE